jgi:hypothetical protein
MAAKMNPPRTVEMRLRCPSSVALRRISEATAEEGFPFLSPTRPRDKVFLSKVNGSEFRIWRWPSKSRGGNQLVPVLHAEVRASDDGSSLTGAFRLHPFAKALPWFMALVLLGIAATVWFQSRNVEGWLFAAFFLLMAVGAILFAFQDRSPRLREEDEIIQFLENLFADVR